MGKTILTITLIASVIFLSGCTNRGVKKAEEQTVYPKGTYGYDVSFFKRHNIETIELKDSITNTSVLIAPGYQGRVMTSTSAGSEGNSFGWINYKYIEAGKFNEQFNPVGGEERLWLGPEGGPFSIYFLPGKEQVFANWRVPAAIDTEPFETVEKSAFKVSFKREFTLTNASGTVLPVGIERSIKLLNKQETENCIGIALKQGVSAVVYETTNTLINRGTNVWDEKSGALSIWMLSMFNPSPKGVVFIPFKTDKEADPGTIVNDEYFGKVPSDRLIIKDSLLFFRVDGKHRSKIGITPKRVLPYAGGYDPINKVLTLLWCDLPETPSKYVNSKWGNQDDPFSGDVVNSYNDGPVDDGSIMGPFYEIESSSPAAFLQPGGKISHTQRIFHISGEEDDLNEITQKIFGVAIDEIKSVF